MHTSDSKQFMIVKRLNLMKCHFKALFHTSIFKKGTPMSFKDFGTAGICVEEVYWFLLLASLIMSFRVRKQQLFNTLKNY